MQQRSNLIRVYQYIIEVQSRIRCGAWVLGLLLAIGCAGSHAPDTGPDPDERRIEIRRLIKRNLHFNFHGFHMVVDGRPGPGVEAEHVIRVGAANTMVRFREAARSYLEAAARDGRSDAARDYLRVLDRQRQH